MSQNLKIDAFVPHSGQMSLLDDIVDYGDDWLLAKVTITPSSLFIDEQGVPASVGVEYLAQAIAAYSGLQEHQHGGTPKLGFLLGVRKYLCSTDYFTVGETLLLKVELDMQAENGLSVFQGSLTGRDIEGSARLNVFQPDNADHFLQGSV
jgi:predicted hotdog family 3-hydroxylacyl-ACP dehydratase